MVCYSDLYNSRTSDLDRRMSGLLHLVSSYNEACCYPAVMHIYENPFLSYSMYLFLFSLASWKNPFHPLFTKEADFFVDANTTVKVNMMYRKGYYDFQYDDALNCWAIIVPYDGDYSAWFILPDQGKLKSVEDALTTERVGTWRRSLIHE